MKCRLGSKKNLGGGWETWIEERKGELEEKAGEDPTTKNEILLEKNKLQKYY